MSSATLARPVSVTYRTEPTELRHAWLEEDSPFGLQGLSRETLSLLKPDAINSLAVALALKGTPEQIRDLEFVSRILVRNESWLQEYRVVHLIERSLWIDGHCDLVMTLTKNPSQIPDNPPRQVVEALMLANRLHPQSTIWYGVPLFGEQTDGDGLPIPLTATQVRVEAQRRITAAQEHALRWGWLYRTAWRAWRTPAAIWQSVVAACRQVRRRAVRCRDYVKQAQRDARCRARARILAHSEYCRLGRSETIVPEHTTSLGRFTEQAAESLRLARELIANRLPDSEAMSPLLTGGVPVALHSLTLVGLAPMFITPMTIVACDPFLFVELPDEPNKLRHLGHWYWQAQLRGEQKLHVHV
ncbi:MAG: hypothetical protein U0872_02540 [Planctomycetaceae bacterium]